MITRLDLPRGNQDAKRNGQVETPGFLGQIGWSEIDGDAFLREIEATVLQCGTHAVTRFFDLGVRQADQGERQAARPRYALPP